MQPAPPPNAAASTATPAAALPGLCLAAVALVLAGCEPIGPIPGGRLHGELVEDAVEDWSFAAPYQTILLETRRASDPHSVTVWCFIHDGHLYIPSRHPREKKWVHNVLEDPRVRLKIGGRIYPARAEHVTDEAELAVAVPALLEKYDLEPPTPEEARDAWVFRIRWREPGRARG